jgi:hypothetical protein
MNENTKPEIQNMFIGGIADYDKQNAPASYYFGRSIDIRSNPREIKLLPKTTKESGSTITDLPKWADRISDDTYLYGDAGNLYKRTLAGSYSLLRTVPNSHGNGLSYFGEDDYLYYASDKVIGRYGQVTNASATPTFTDDFLGSEGGVPTNTYALDLEASSSQYATAADSASLSITSNFLR